MKKPLDGDMKEKEKKVVHTPVISSPFAPAKKQKPSIESLTFLMLLIF